MIFIEGNHEVRLRRALINKLPQLFGVKRADVGENEKSVLHLANLMRFEDLGWTYWDEPSDVYPHQNMRSLRDYLHDMGTLLEQKLECLLLLTWIVLMVQSFKDILIDLLSLITQDGLGKR